jgi:hypothetical protein
LSVFQVGKLFLKFGNLQHAAENGQSDFCEELFSDKRRISMLYNPPHIDRETRDSIAEFS